MTKREQAKKVTLTARQKALKKAQELKALKLTHMGELHRLNESIRLKNKLLRELEVEVCAQSVIIDEKAKQQSKLQGKSA